MEGPLINKVGRLALCLARNPGDLVRWGSNLIRPPLESGLPWISYGAIDFLDKWLQPTHRVFEYGSGGSTLYFARRTAQVLSVEADTGWLARTVHMTKAHTNVTVRLETQTQGVGDSPYCMALNSEFDVILIDGEDNWPAADMRPACFERAENFVSAGGIIILDDAWRPYSIKPKRAIGHKQFTSVGPYRIGVTRTDILFY